MRPSHRRPATPECLIVIDDIVFGVGARRRKPAARIGVVGCLLATANFWDWRGLIRASEGHTRLARTTQSGTGPPAAAHLRRVALVRTRFAAKTATGARKRLRCQ